MRFIGAVLILSGMIIGVGMFGIPFSFVKAGFWLGVVELLILSGVVLVFHLLYGEIVLKTPEKHRLPGYIKVYLGGAAAKLAWASAFFGITGTLLAYLVLGSVFLHNIFRVWPEISEFEWALILALAGAAATFFSLKKEALINGLATFLLVLLLFFLSFSLLPQVKLANLQGLDFKNIFLPYGVLLFALSGGVVIPDLITFLGGSRRRIRAAISVGTLLPAVLYFFFALTVVGVLGSQVSPEAVQSLAILGIPNLVLAGSLIGFLAVFTSLLVLSSSFQALLELDLKLPKSLAWFLGSFLPLIFYFLGLKNFIWIIGAVGSIAVGIDSALILASYQRLKKKENYNLGWFSYLWSWGIYIMIAAGVGYYILRSIEVGFQ